VTDTPPGAVVVPVALPMALTAGAVNGIAVALARADVALYYLVDNAALEGPPVWVHEAEVEKCRVVGITT
jgi:hypothetical protein